MELYRVNGNSMNPLLQDGDKVFGVSEFEVDKLKKYDLLIFEHKGVLFCHYFWKLCESFVESEGTLLQTRPLNPIWEVDEPIAFSKIKAKVVGKKISLFLKMKINVYGFFIKR